MYANTWQMVGDFCFFDSDGFHLDHVHGNIRYKLGRWFLLRLDPRWVRWHNARYGIFVLDTIDFNAVY